MTRVTRQINKQIVNAGVLFGCYTTQYLTGPVVTIANCFCTPTKFLVKLQYNLMLLYLILNLHWPVMPCLVNGWVYNWIIILITTYLISTKPFNLILRWSMNWVVISYCYTYISKRLSNIHIMIILIALLDPVHLTNKKPKQKTSNNCLTENAPQSN